jgi:hypothetical protein
MSLNIYNNDNNQTVIIEQPTVEQPTVEQPIVKQPIVKQPTVEQPFFQNFSNICSYMCIIPLLPITFLLNFMTCSACNGKYKCNFEMKNSEYYCCYCYYMKQLYYFEDIYNTNNTNNNEDYCFVCCELCKCCKYCNCNDICNDICNIICICDDNDD